MGMPAPAQIELDTLEILKRVSDRPIEPTPQSELMVDLGFDSIQVIELVGELEDHFNVSIPLNELPKIRTVADMLEALHRLMQESQSVG